MAVLQGLVGLVEGVEEGEDGRIIEVRLVSVSVEFLGDGVEVLR